MTIDGILDIVDQTVMPPMPREAARDFLEDLKDQIQSRIEAMLDDPEHIDD